MRRAMLLLATALIFIAPTYGFSSEQADELPKWLELLRKGNAKEKKLAMRNLWFLEYQEYRKDPKVFAPILNTLLKDKDPSVREAAANVLKRIGDYSKGCCKETEIAPSLIKALEDTSPRVRREAALALAYYKDDRAIDPLIKSLRDNDLWVRLNAVYSLGVFKAQKAVDPLVDLLNDDSDWRNKFVQQECIIALKKIWSVAGFDKEAKYILMQKLNDEYLRAEILKTVGFPGGLDRNDMDTLLKLTSDSNENVRKLAVAGLSTVMFPSEDDPRSDIYLKLLKDPSAVVRTEVVQRLGFIGKKNKNTIEALLKASEDSNAEVRQKAADVLANNFYDDRIFAVLLRYISMYDGENKFLKYAEKTATQKTLYKTQYGGFTNLANPAAATELLKALDSKDYNKAQIIRMLGNFNDKRIYGRLKGFLDDPLPEVRQWAVYSLGRSGNIDVVPELINALKDKNIDIKIVAARYLADSRDNRAVEPLMEMLHDSNDKAKGAALNALGSFDDQRIPDINLKLLDDQSVDVKIAAVSNVARKHDQRAFEPIIKILDGEVERSQHNTGLKTAAIVALGAMGDKRAAPILIRVAEQKEARMAAIEALSLIKSKESVPILTKYLSDESLALETRRHALLAIGEIGDPSALEALEQLFYDKSSSQFGKPIIIETVGKINSEKAVQILMTLLNTSDNFSDVNQVIIQLGKLKNRKAIKPLLKVVGKNKLYSFNAARAIKQWEDTLIIDAIISYLNDTDAQVKKGAIIVLGGFGTEAEKAIEPLKKLLDDPDPEIKNDTKNTIKTIESSLSYKEIKKEGHFPLPQASGRLEFGEEYKRGYEGIGAGAPGFSKKEKLQTKQEPLQKDAVIIEPTKKTTADISPYLKKLKSKDYKIRRQAADDLGDIGVVKAVQHIIPLLKDKNEYVRQAAARALGKLKDKGAVEPLIAALKDPDTNVLAFTILALGEIQDPRAAEPLAPLLLSREEKVRERAFEAIRKFQDPASKKFMVNTLMKARENWMLQRLISLEGEEVVLKTFEDPGGDKIKTVRNYINIMAGGNNTASGIASKALRNDKDRELVISEAADRIKNGSKDASIYIGFLGSLNDRSVLPILIEALKDRKGMDRYSAIEAIGKLGGYKEIEGILMEILVDGNEGGVRAHAARALGKLGDKKAVDTLIKIAQDDKEIKNIKMGVIAALGDIKDKKAIEPLTKIIKNTQNDVWLRVAAISSLGDIGDENSIAVIQEAASNDSTGYIKGAAEIALRKIKTGK